MKRIAILELAVLALFSSEADTFYYYAASSRLLHGQIMYRDFAFVQFPLLPYIYAPFFFFMGNSILVARFVGFILGCLTLMVSLRCIPNENENLFLWLTILFFSPICFLVQFDTKGYFPAFLIVMLLYLSGRERPYLAGVTAGLLGLVKATYLPIGLFYFLANRKHPVAFFMPYIGIISATAFLFYRLDPVKSFFFPFKALPLLMLSKGLQPVDMLKGGIAVFGGLLFPLIGILAIKGDYPHSVFAGLLFVWMCLTSFVIVQSPAYAMVYMPFWFTYCAL